ncbi:MAG: hypothetical protein IJH62_00140 [Mogibacterium sp.]|nr:hypothetical protein [Mogibacterium sp.]
MTWKYSDATTNDLTDGIHKVKIESCDFNAETSTGKPCIKLIFQVEGSFIRVYHVILKNTQWAGRQIARVGVCFQIPEGSENPSDWVNRTGYIRTIHKETQGGAVYINVATNGFIPPEKVREELFKAKQEADAKKFYEERDKAASSFGAFDPDSADPFNVPDSLF